MTLRQSFRTAVAMVGAAVTVILVIAREELAAIPDVHASFYAKEACSCLYVVGRDVTYCKSYARQLFVPSEVHFDEVSRAVTARTLWGAAQRARYVASPYGCRLDRLTDEGA